MALHSDFPESPHAIIDPKVRWLPDQSLLFGMDYAMLLPPLVQKIREQVKTWRDDNYKDASETSKALLNWWFKTPHLREQTDGTMEQFQYYFAQREALETIIYLYDVVKVKDEVDQGHLVVHIYFISVDTFYEIGLDFHAISRKNVNIRKLKSKAEPKTK